LIKNNQKIDLAICSHNDSDHSNGLIGLLKSPLFEIKEIWLPATWVPILDFIIEKGINGELDYFLHEYIEESNLAINDNKKSLDYSSLVKESNISIETFDDKLQFISEIETLDYFYLYRLIYHHHWPINEFINEFINFDRIIKIAGLAYKKGSLIRWFKPENNNPAIQDPNYGFKPLNSREIVVGDKIDKVDRSNFFNLLQLTNENKYSLVFEFYTENKPIILFSADSDFSFLVDKTYKNNIIVTAPHHGSGNNAIVYTKIIGDNIIWIRSDRRNTKRPCSDFKKLSDKYCLACALKNQKKEICFEYDFKNYKWNYRKGIKCTCCYATMCSIQCIIKQNNSYQK